MKIRTGYKKSKSNIHNLNALESRAAQASPYLGCKQPECFIFSKQELNKSSKSTKSFALALKAFRGSENQGFSDCSFITKFKQINEQEVKNEK